MTPWLPAVLLGACLQPAPAAAEDIDCFAAPPPRASLRFWEHVEACGCAGIEPPSQASPDYGRWRKTCADWLPCPPAPSRARTRDARVVGVPTGDSVDLLTRSGQHRVRLHGIGAPAPGEPFGDAARQRLSELLLSQDVGVQVIQPEPDGTFVARVFVNGLDAARELVAEGLARACSPLGTCSDLTAAEAGARDAHRGVWSASGAAQCQ